MSLFLACALTVLLETPLFAAAGYRDRTSLTIVICANIVTNLTLNLALSLLPRSIGAAAMGEALVLAAEYGAYAFAFGPSRRLFMLTLAANVLSCGVGLLLFQI